MSQWAYDESICLWAYPPNSLWAYKPEPYESFSLDPVTLNPIEPDTYEPEPNCELLSLKPYEPMSLHSMSLWA